MSLTEIFNSLPPVTRHVMLGLAVVTIPPGLALYSPSIIAFIPNKVFGKLEVWRLVTPFLYCKSQPMNMIFDVFMLFRNLREIETGRFAGRTADLVWAFTLIGSAILAGDTYLGIGILFRPFMVALCQLWASANPTGQIALFGLVQIPSIYFPWVMVGMDLLQGSILYSIHSFSGLAAAYAYDYLLNEYPRNNGGRQLPFLQTPKFILDTFGGSPPPPTPTSSRPGPTNNAGGGWMFGFGSSLSGGGQRLGGSAPPPLRSAGDSFTSARAAGPSNGSTTTTYRWGSGNKLGN